MSKRLTVRLTDETAGEIEKMAGEMSMNMGQLAGLCVTFGLEALKMALNPANSAVMSSIADRIDKAVDEAEKRPYHKKE